MRECLIRSVSRIHITLIDLGASSNYIDGGAGFILEEPYHVISVSRSLDNKNRIIAQDAVDEEIISRAKMCLERFLESQSVREGFEIKLLKTYPLHIGLGGTTQLCMSIATGLWHLLYREKPDHVEIARIIGRGGTSGIGVHGFALGGFIVDGGHLRGVEKNEALPSDYSRAPPPPLLVREDLPENWSFILIRPRELSSRIFGERELEIFRRNTPIKREEVFEVAYHVLFGLLNAVKRRDIELFKRHVRSIQEIGFKRVEWLIQGESIRRIRETLDSLDISYGLSSMGPTLYIPTLDNEKEEIRKRIVDKLDPDKYLVEISRGRNTGYEKLCS